MMTDADLMLALYTRLAQLTGAVVLLGEPSAVRSAPLVYLMGYQTDYRSSGGHEIIDMRPRIRLVVRWQDAPNAEFEMLGLEAQIHELVTAQPTILGACTVRWEQTLYGYLSVGG